MKIRTWLARFKRSVTPHTMRELLKYEERKRLRVLALREAIYNMWKLPKDPSRAEVRQWLEERIRVIEQSAS